MIDRVYQTLRMLANTEIRGNMKPFAFNLALHKVILEIFEQYPFELNKWKNRLNKGLVNPGEQNIVDLLQEKIDFHLESATLIFSAGEFTLPSTLGYLGTIIYTTNNSEVSLCKNYSEFNQIKRFKHTQPSIDFPIGFRKARKVEILPVSITTNVIATYRRTPKIPKWTFVMVNGAELFNPSAPDFSDIDMHSSEFNEIVTALCREFGINLKENDLLTAALNEDAIKENKENNS